ncbi:uncharacterized protein [Littorina saxatilis]|uniref:uncharacterized protein n=1 Tax=Littorina saxatilis TaxID=31220 RepID=UPI0038B62BBF
MKFTSSTVRLELCLVVIFLGTCTDAKAAGVPDENDCIVDREGKTLVMTFCLRKYSQAPGAFYAHLIRERNMTADILTCDKTNGKISCIGVDHTFHVEGVIEDALKVRVPNVSSNRVETFLLRVFFNETRQPPIVCNLTMTEINSYTEDKANNPGIRDGSIAGILIAIVIIIAIVVGGIYFIYRRKCPPACWKKIDRGTALETTQAILLPTSDQEERPGEPEQKSTEETGLTGGNRGRNNDNVLSGTHKEPQSRGASAVSVSIQLTGGNSDTNNVLCKKRKEPHSREISAVSVSKRDTTDNKAERSGKTEEKSPEETRSSVAEREGERSSNTQPEKEDELGLHGYPRYYYGKLSKEEEEKLLLSENNGPGSFLIKDGTDATQFVLSVNTDKEVRHYPFRRFGSNYILGLCVVTTMQKLTEYYKKYDIDMFDDKCRLVKPVEDKAVSK